jgi:hypothetical protein
MLYNNKNNLYINNNYYNKHMIFLKLKYNKIIINFF